MRALVFLEESDGELTTGARGLVAKARELSGDSCAVLCGTGVLDLANQVSTYGASRLFVADDPALATPLSQPRVEIIAALVRLGASTRCCWRTLRWPRISLVPLRRASMPE